MIIDECQNRTITEAVEKAIETWGTESQIYVAIEELAELTQALTKWLREPSAELKKQRLPQIEEEFADVIFGLACIKEICKPQESEISKTLNDKIQRLYNRIYIGKTSTGAEKK
jgi:NTP pyrophosphatase (non-canonical NTP hydrolase)